jgi:hypothetical protein
MQAVFNTTSRGFGAFFERWDALPTPKVGTTEYLTISDNPSVPERNSGRKPGVNVMNGSHART